MFTVGGMKMSIKDLSRDELELYSHKDLTNMLLEERGAMNTAELFKEITTLLGLPNSVYENKIGDYYTTLTTDKRFIMLEDGKWDLRDNHTSDKVVVLHETEEDEEEIEEDEEENKEESDVDDENNDDFDSARADDEFDDPTDEDLKDLVILDEDELELEE
ncbi:MAG: DNA-directed RNA polymerase subunit delta [Firmicutes bacterium]|nr:DNA-directed RNA polymerase subunit delta [Bacillota bacterium]